MMNMPPTYGNNAQPMSSPMSAARGTQFALGGIDFETAISLISLISSFTRR